MRQMSYSMCRFWAYEESKKYVGAGKNAPAWKLALAGSMGEWPRIPLKCVRSSYPYSYSRGYRWSGRESWRYVDPNNLFPSILSTSTSCPEIVMVRLQGDFAKPPEKRFGYKHCFDALYRVSASSLDA